jgi:hypothetical protein
MPRSGDCDEMMMEFDIPEDDYDYYDRIDCMETVGADVEGLEACSYTIDSYGDNCWVEAYLNG